MIDIAYIFPYMCLKRVRPIYKMPLIATEKQRNYIERKRTQMGEQAWKQKDRERKDARKKNPEITRQKATEST